MSAAIKIPQNISGWYAKIDKSIDYDSLADGPFNIVLQNIFPNDDDGSLSWEALRRGVRYLNIETRLGYLTQQKKMLSFVESNLD